MSKAEPEVWVVVMSNDGCRDNDNGPLVMETYTKGATRDAAMTRAAQLDRLYSACRIARLVFDDQPTTKDNT